MTEIGGINREGDRGHKMEVNRDDRIQKDR
jgi:hypothetical protein